MRKKEKIQWVLIGGVILATTIILAVRNCGSKEEESTWISRPETGTKHQNVVMEFGETTKEWTLAVESREKSAEEIEGAFSETVRLLKEQLEMQDDRTPVLTESITLLEYMAETGVSIRWNSSDTAVLTREGIVHRESLKDVCEINLQARMTFAGEEREHWFAVKVQPYEQGSTEALLCEVQESLQELERETSGEDGFYLPEEIGTVTVSLARESGTLAGVLAVVLLCLPFAAVLAKRQEKEREKKQREEDLLTAYPQLITKLTLYIGAGMSLRGAWERLAAEYRAKAEASGKKTAVGEEILVLAGELKNGTSEARVYEAFGRKIALKPYMRCASLLVSQLQKGSGGLRKSLETEVQLAWEMHRERVTKKGEEAQTKLLFPMMGMLFLVMAVVLIPAFFSL